MKTKLAHVLLAISLLTLVGCSTWPFSRLTPVPPVATPQPTTAVAIPASPDGPFALISQETLFAFLADLTAIQPYSGWRNSATEGEAQALDYVAGELGEMGYLQELGLELERQSFHVFSGTEQWETHLHLTVEGQEIEVPADGLRGPRDDLIPALRFDSDGVPNDSTRDPVVVEGEVLLVRTPDEIGRLTRGDVEGKLVFLDYEAIDGIVQGSTYDAVGIAWELLEKEPAGLVLVTRFSNRVGESHGAFVGDNSALNWVETETAPPTLYVRLEDLAPAGISDWGDLKRVDAARLTWDADVFSPGTSGNLVAHIPGADTSQALILAAHIDSPNNAGAMDDGSGCAILLEVARVLNASRTQPPTDLYLVWFGSEELGLFGASHFALTHQELLDRTAALLQIDCLTRPLDGIVADITLVAWSYGRLGDDRLLWPEHLSGAAAAHGVATVVEDLYQVYSDNSMFSGFDVPNADLIYVDEEAMEATGSLHYAAHIHDPYDTVELARDVGDVLEQMAHVALAAVLEPPPELSALRVTPRADRRALFVASHTEPVHMAPTSFIDLGMALAWEGFDVDVAPYGQPVTAADLEGADLVIALPVVDYPSPGGDLDLYDEAWSAAEIDALEAYVTDGGLLLLTNSAHRIKYGNLLMDVNEDWEDVNALGERFGVAYQEGTLVSGEAWTEGEHPLLVGVPSLTLVRDNGIPFDVTDGQVLAQAGGKSVVALVDHGQGQVLVLADLSILGSEWGPPANLQFWRNLAQYAR
jgi:hypothetical protein